MCLHMLGGDIWVVLSCVELCWGVLRGDARSMVSVVLCVSGAVCVDILKLVSFFVLLDLTLPMCTGLSRWDRVRWLGVYVDGSSWFVGELCVMVVVVCVCIKFYNVFLGWVFCSFWSFDVSRMDLSLFFLFWAWVSPGGCNTRSELLLSVFTGDLFIGLFLELYSGVLCGSFGSISLGWMFDYLLSVLLACGIFIWYVEVGCFKEVCHVIPSLSELSACVEVIGEEVCCSVGSIVYIMGVDVAVSASPPSWS